MTVTLNAVCSLGDGESQRGDHWDARIRSGCQLTTEQWLSVIASLSPKNAAIQLAVYPTQNRPLTQGELVIITSQINEPKVLAKFKEALFREEPTSDAECYASD